MLQEEPELNQQGFPAFRGALCSREAQKEQIFN